MATNTKKVGSKTTYFVKDGIPVVSLQHAGGYKNVIIPQADYERLILEGMPRASIATWGRDNYGGQFGNQTNAQANKTAKAYLSSQAKKGGGLFGGGLGGFLKAAAPVGLSLAFPGIGTAIGSALGAGAAFAPYVGNALVGAATGALTGGGKGALTGALGSVIGTGVGNLAKGTFGGAGNAGPGGGGITTLSDGSKINWNAPTNAATSTSAGPISWNPSPTSGGGIGALAKALGVDDIKDLGSVGLKLLNAAESFQDPEDMYPAGTLSQKDIQAQAEARAAEQQRQNERFVASLNAPPMNRQRMPGNNIDYSTYGQTPQNANNLFFEDVNPRMNNLTLKDGGYVKGPGGPEDDMIPARLSNGEFVLTAKATKALGPKNLNKINKAAKKGSKKKLGALGSALKAA